MNLSIVVVTAGKPYAHKTLSQMRAWADMLGAQLVIAGDKDEGAFIAVQYAHTLVNVEITNGLGESAIPALVKACAHEWILRLDDDETGSDAMLEWMQRGEWISENWDAYSFPRANLWGDENHFITNAPLWEDKQTRLTRRDILARWENKVHAGQPASRNADVSAMLLHHKFLVRTYAERQETARHYDSLRAGAGTDDHFGRFTLPELFFVNGVNVREVGSGAVELGQWVNTGELVACSRKTGRDSMAIGKSGWDPSRGNLYAA